MLCGSVEMVSLVLLGVAMSAMMMPQSSARKLRDGPGKRVKKYFVSLIDESIVFVVWFVLEFLLLWSSVARSVVAGSMLL
jgi:hypothetical protein